jgi:carbohydrate-binding DOMON domain-containing protein
MGNVCRRLGTAALATGLALGLALAAATPAALAQKVSFKDPRDDDDGPGKYTYPTDPVYKPGSFDLTGFTLKAHGDKVDLEVEMAAKLEDPWKTGSGFSVQMVLIFVQTRAEKQAAGKPEAAKAGAGGKKSGAHGAAGGKAGARAAADQSAAKAAAGRSTAEKAGAGEPPAPQPGAEKAAAGPSAAGNTAEAKPAAAKPAGERHGFTQGLPGLQVQFAPDDAWDRCIILSPEPASRVRAEVEAKAAAMRDAIVVPARVRGSGHAISATIDRKALGPGDPTDWGYQVVIASSDPYPAADSLLVRKVTETESQHRFGGGGACGPNVLDALAGDGKGEPGEAAKQHEMLQYECNPDSTPKKLATLKMVHVDKDEDED